MDNAWEPDEEQVAVTRANAGMSADRMAVISVATGALALVSYVALLGPHWLVTLWDTFPDELFYVFGCGTWIVASIVSFGFAFSSLRKIRSSLNPTKVRRLAIGVLVGNGLLWALTCAFIVYLTATTD